VLPVSLLRVATRYWRGQRPHVEDMERIVRYLRRRRERGLPAVPSSLLERIQGLGRSDPNRLVGLQTRKLRRTVEYVYRYLPFYREAMDAQGVKPTDMRSLADVHKLPITRREQLADSPEAFVSRRPGLVASAFARTGGTTGKPLVVYLTNDELSYYTVGEAIAGLMMGWLGPTEILQTHFSQDTSIEALVLAGAARKAGTLVLSFSPTSTLDDHVESIFQERHLPGKKSKVSMLMISPSHLWTLTRRAEEMGVDFGESGIRRIQTGGAMVGEDLRQRVMETWGVRLSEGFGLAELVTCAAVACDKSDRLHLSDFTAYAEVLDPETREPIPPGKPGVLVITTFYPDRELMPVLRYWTEDIVILSADRRCACGLLTTQILDIVGRADHRVKIGTRTVYPQQVGDSLLAFPELVQPPRFTLRTEQHVEAQHAVLDVEVGAGLSPEDTERLRQRIAEGVVLSQYWQVRLGSVKLVVNLRAAGSLEQPFPYKHRHLVMAHRGE
jgi:phenylacetate-CoA ligase